MAFPIINVKGSNLELTDELKILIEQKITPIEKFLPKDETDIKCDVEIEKINDQQSGNIFRAEINLFVAGIKYRAEKTEDQIEKAIDRARDELKKEVRRSRGKHDSLIKRGGRKIKDMLRFGE